MKIACQVDSVTVVRIIDNPRVFEYLKKDQQGNRQEVSSDIQIPKADHGKEACSCIAILLEEV